MIVAMENIQIRQTHSQKFHDGALEKNPAVRLIRIVFSGHHIQIDSFAIKEPIIADKKILNLRIRKVRDVNIERQMFEPERNGTAVAKRERLKAEPVKIDDSIAGDNDAYSGAELFQLA